MVRLNKLAQDWFIVRVQEVTDIFATYSICLLLYTSLHVLFSSHPLFVTPYGLNYVSLPEILMLKITVTKNVTIFWRHDL